MTKKELDICAEKAKGLTHRDLVAIVEYAVFNDANDDSQICITSEDMLQAIEARKKYIQKGYLEQFNRFLEENEPAIKTCMVALTAVGIVAGLGLGAPAAYAAICKVKFYTEALAFFKAASASATLKAYFGKMLVGVGGMEMLLKEIKKRK